MATRQMRRIFPAVKRQERAARLKDIERSKDALVSHYASLVPQVLTELSSQEKNRILKLIHLHILAQRDGPLIADRDCNVLPLPRWSSTSTTEAFRFRVVLTGAGSEEVELTTP